MSPQEIHKFLQQYNLEDELRFLTDLRVSSTHKGLFSDTRHCLYFKSDIRHWVRKLVNMGPVSVIPLKKQTIYFKLPNPIKKEVAKPVPSPSQGVSRGEET